MPRPKPKLRYGEIPLKTYIVSYKGLWLGGAAVVLAATAAEATRLTKKHARTVNFDNVSVSEVKGPILYNDNGDY